jgi:hypothetical protein
MNFWEARQAALEGRRVKRLISKDEFWTYDANDFLIRPMAPCEVNGHWEIIEEPENKSYVVDGNGRLVEAVNLEIRFDEKGRHK